MTSDKPKQDGAQVGNEFTLDAKLSYEVDDKIKGDCKLEWWEWTTRLTKEQKKIEGTAERKWSQYYPGPFVTTFDDWEKYKKAKKPCPGKYPPIVL